MKPFLLGLTLICSAAPLWAQKPVGSRAFTAEESRRSLWPKFQRMSHGQYVGEFAALQYLLRNQGFYKGTPTGVFDAKGSNKTENAIKAFQRAKGLKVDGIVGTQSWPKLLVRLKKGDRGDAVRALQTLLNTQQDDRHEPIYGAVKVDGIFGTGTDRVLKLFQKDNALITDGVAGPQTWSLLLSPAVGD
ncbi:peptidoglycan-binding protein [bacterium]|nr:MAG: peptidoglycan-binding protein [bacterium]